MSKNEGFGTFHLSIRRDGKWEQSIQSECEAYLERTAINWMDLGTIDAYRIDLFPPVAFKPNPKGAFGLPRDGNDIDVSQLRGELMA